VTRGDGGTGLKDASEKPVNPLSSEADWTVVFTGSARDDRNSTGQMQDRTRPKVFKRGEGGRQLPHETLLLSKNRLGLAGRGRMWRGSHGVVQESVGKGKGRTIT